jgi:hypothetical protein
LTFHLVESNDPFLKALLESCALFGHDALSEDDGPKLFMVDDEDFGCRNSQGQMTAFFVNRCVQLYASLLLKNIIAHYELQASTFDHFE